MYGALFSPCLTDEHDATLVARARELTPRVERAAPGLVVLDLAGLGRRWPSPEALGHALVEHAAAAGQGDVHAAIAATRTAARLLARGRPGLSVVAPGEEAAALAPLPLALLELPEERQALFARWGLRTLGELARLPAVGLAERLGPDGPRLRRMALGEDEAPLVPQALPERFESTLEVEWPVEGLEPLAFLLARVLETLCGALRERGRRATALTLDLRLVDGRLDSRTLRPAAPSVEPRTWRTLLLLELEARVPGEAVQALTVRAEPTPARSVQFSLLDPAQPAPEKLAEMLARLREWTDAGRAGAPRLLDSHRPDAFVLETFDPGPARPLPVRPPLWPRVALRRFRPPLPATVRLEAGAPTFVEAAGVRGPVRDRAGPWRASGDWWDAAWSREEWDVALPSGVYRIFRDRLREGWYVEGEVD